MRCAGAGTPATSRSARACTGTWGSPTRHPARARRCSSTPGGSGRSPAPPGCCTRSTSPRIRCWPRCSRTCRLTSRRPWPGGWPPRSAARRSAGRGSRGSTGPGMTGRPPAEPAAELPHSLLSPGGQPLTEEQRARWVSLASRAADKAGLPADPGVPVRLRVLPGVVLPGTGIPPSGGQPAPVPTWDWGPGGPPAPAEQDASADAAPPVTLPGPGEPVSFDRHIKPLFRDRDRQSMSFAFDLWSADDVRAHAQAFCSGCRTEPCPATAPGRPTRSRSSSAGQKPACDPDRRISRGPGPDHGRLGRRAPGQRRFVTRPR